MPKLTKYNVMGRFCYRLWSWRANAWRYVPVKVVDRAGNPAALGYSATSPYNNPVRAYNWR